MLPPISVVILYVCPLKHYYILMVSPINLVLVEAAYSVCSGSPSVNC